MAVAMTKPLRRQAALMWQMGGRTANAVAMSKPLRQQAVLRWQMAGTTATAVAMTKPLSWQAVLRWQMDGEQRSNDYAVEVTDHLNEMGDGGIKVLRSQRGGVNSAAVAVRCGGRWLQVGEGNRSSSALNGRSTC